MDDFLSMGRYGDFVWASYGVCFALLATLIVLSVRSCHACQRALKVLEGNRARRRPRSAVKDRTETV